MGNKQNTKKLLPWKEAWQLNRRALLLIYRKYPRMVWSTVADNIWGALTPYVGISLSALIIEELSGNRDLSRLAMLILITLLSSALISLVSALLQRYREIADAASRHHKIRYILSEKMLDMDFNVIDNPNTHQKLSTILQYENGGGWGISRVLSGFGNLLSSISNLSGGIILTVTLFTSRVSDQAGNMAFLNSPLFIVVILGVMLLTTWLSPALSVKGNSYKAINAELHNLANRLFGYWGWLGNNTKLAADMRIYRQDKLCDKYNGNKTDTFGSQGIFAKLSWGIVGFYHCASTAVACIFTLIVYLFVCVKAWAGAFGIGMVTQYIRSVSKFCGGMGHLFNTVGDMRNNASFLKQIFDFLDIPNEMYQGSLTIEKRNDRKYEVEFRDVSFRYPGSEAYALHHVNMTFQVGQRLAVVGQNGSGKTTFIKLLCRLYDPTEGIILLNGIDIRKYDYQEYLSIFSVVFQDFQLLDFTLGQNLAAKIDYDKSLAEHCLEKAGFGERLKELPAGTDTYLEKTFSDDGVSLSGGERQKVAIARTLYKNAPFIVLDEPTAALDPMAEAEIYSRLNDIIEDKTAIYISHRLSSCRFCDDILVFDRGAVVQQGNHDTLVADLKGKYHELWHAQAQYYADSSSGQEGTPERQGA